MSTRTFRPVLVAVAAAAVLMILGGCGRHLSTAAPPPPRPKVEAAANWGKASKPDDPAGPSSPSLGISQEGLTFKWVEQGQVRMTATASNLSGNDISGIVVVKDFAGKLYQQGKLTATLHAPKALVDTARRVVTAMGGVTVKSLERDTIANSAWMKWSEKAQKLIGGGGVTVNSATMGDMTGAAFEADTGLKSWKLTDGE